MNTLKDKIVSLRKYAQQLNDRITSETPIKHKNREKSYKNFLNNELRIAKTKLEKLVLEVGGK